MLLRAYKIAHRIYSEFVPLWCVCNQPKSHFTSNLNWKLPTQNKAKFENVSFNCLWLTWRRHKLVSCAFNFGWQITKRLMWKAVKTHRVKMCRKQVYFKIRISFTITIYIPMPLHWTCKRANIHKKATLRKTM